MRFALVFQRLKTFGCGLQNDQRQRTSWNPDEMDYFVETFWQGSRWPVWFRMGLYIRPRLNLNHARRCVPPLTAFVQAHPHYLCQHVL
jgi:hypothetical protein